MRPRRRSGRLGHIAGLRDPDRFEAWLHRLLVNACYREAGRTDGGEPRGQRRDPGDSGAGYAASTSPTAIRSNAAFDGSTLDQRTVLVLHYYLGLSLDEAAEVLGIPRAPSGPDSIGRSSRCAQRSKRMPARD